MATKGMAEFRADGENYTINDPNIANEFSASSAYTAGTYVNYQGDLWRFTADHAAGSWTGTDAVKVKIGQDVSDLKSAFSNEQKTFNSIDIDVIGQEVVVFGEPGYYIPTSGNSVDLTDIRHSSAGMIRCAIIDCEPGDEFIINGTGGDAPRLWCFIRSNNTVVLKADSNETRSNYYKVAPAESAKLIIQNNGGECYRGKPFSQVESELSNEHFVPSSWEVGKALNTSGGETSNLKAALSGYTPVLNRSSISYAGAQNNGVNVFWCNVSFYNALKSVIDVSGASRQAMPMDGTEISIPSNAKYIRFAIGFNSSISQNMTSDDLKYFAVVLHKETYNRYTDDRITDALFSVDGNQIVPSSWSLASSYNASGTKAINTPTFACTDKIPLNGHNKIKITFDDAYLATICFFDSTLSFISPRVIPESGEVVSVPGTALYFAITFGRASSWQVNMTAEECNGCVITFNYDTTMLERIIKNESEIDESKQIYNNAIQINDGLNQTAACSSCIAYDTEDGTIFYAYETGLQRAYGESIGKLMLSVFSPSQPTNIRFVTLDEGNGTSRGILCNAIRIIDHMACRVYYSRFDICYYSDYDFYTNTVGGLHELKLRTATGDVRLGSTAYKDYIESNGYSLSTYPALIINKICEYNGEVYTAITPDGVGYPVLCKIEDNVLIPFAIRGTLGRYEFRYYVDETGIHGVYRSQTESTGIGLTGYTVSTDGGETWTDTVFADGVQSRPDILRYYGKPLVVYNYRSSKSTENFPPMHNYRNAIKMIYDGNIIYDCFSKYGIVEHETIPIRGDLYIGFSDCEQALMVENGAGWEEGGTGRYVENGKELIKWKKIGYLL